MFHTSFQEHKSHQIHNQSYYLNVVIPQVESFNTTQTLVNCSSRHQLAWVLSIYIYKAVIIIAGLYFTWKTRRVTLPALRDSRQVTVAVSIAILLSLTALPVLLVVVPSATIKYSVGALAIWFNITATVSLLFLSKVTVFDFNTGDSGRPFNILSGWFEWGGGLSWEFGWGKVFPRAQRLCNRFQNVNSSNQWCI